MSSSLSFFLDLGAEIAHDPVLWAVCCIRSGSGMRSSEFATAVP
jgi:hypothetical protein